VTGGPDCLLEQLIASACRVVGAGEGIGSVVIIADRRLTYPELARARGQAARCRVDVSMDGRGAIAVRRHGEGNRAGRLAIWRNA
jgi:hypothetical protein